MEGSHVNYPENNVTLIPYDRWYRFEADLMKDPGVANKISTYPYIKQIRVFGNGGDFAGCADNIYLGIK